MDNRVGIIHAKNLVAPNATDYESGIVQALRRTSGYNQHTPPQLHGH